MFDKFIKFIRMPLFDKINRIGNIKDKIKTRFYYRFFFKKIGSKTIILSPMFMGNVHRVTLMNRVFIRNNIRLEVVGEGEVYIGNDVSIEQNAHIISGTRLYIGDKTTISANTLITNIDHEYRQINIDILKQPLILKETIINENCFIGYGVAIQAGTILGKQCIVGAHSVVRGVFPDYCVIVGVPAKMIKRYDFEKEIWRKTNENGEFIYEI